MCANSSTAPAGSPGAGWVLAVSVMSSAAGVARESSTTLAITRAFRYVPGMSGRLYRLSIVLICTVLAGCGYKAKTPAEAYKRFVDAVKAGDGGALFDSLDQETRWNWMSIQKFHREAYDIVLSNFPEGPERERATKRFQPAATASSARELFKNDVAPTVLPMFR